jgi:hypothetical protein
MSSSKKIHTVFVYTVYLFTEGGGGGDGRLELGRSLEGQQFKKLGRKYQNVLYLHSPVYKL